MPIAAQLYNLKRGPPLSSEYKTLFSWTDAYVIIAVFTNLLRSVGLADLLDMPPLDGKSSLQTPGLFYVTQEPSL
jgi:hypothetical protein